MSPEPCTATRLVGARPTGALGRISRAIHPILAGLDARTPIVIALSGGADSLALALCAIDSSRRLGLPVHTITVDHSIRPDSADEAAAVAERARALGAEARVISVDVGRNGGPEAAARDARYAALRAVLADIRASAVSTPAPVVLLGHTMDDQAETVLLRLARGSGARSMRSISPETIDGEGVRWMRPLLSLRRSDTRDACEQAGLEWFEDPSNAADGPWRAADGTPLRRAAVRADVLPALARALGTDPVPALARTAALAASDDDALEQWAHAVWADVVRTASPEPGRAGRMVLDVRGLETQPRAIRTRVLRRFALDEGVRAGDLSARHIDALDSLIISWHGQGPIDVPAGRILRTRDERGSPVLVAELQSRCAPGADYADSEL